MMNPRVKKLWVEALRSGKYKQTREELYYEEDGSYCCLGVLTRLWAREKKRSFEAGLNPFNEGFPSDSVIAWAGLQKHVDENNDVHLGTKQAMRASYANDAKGYSFNKIAKLIEDRL